MCSSGIVLLALLETALATRGNEGAPPAPSYWLAPDSRLEHGTVRARLTTRSSMDATLLVRARVAPDGVEGWGVRLADCWAWMVEVQGGEIRPLSHRVLVPRDPSRTAIEVEISLFGGALVATVWDGESGRPLAIVSAEGIPVHEGAFAIAPAGSAGVRPAALSLLSERPACTAVPALYGASPAVAVTLPQAWRTLAVAHATELEPAPHDPEAAVFRTDGHGLERLFCAGVPLLRVESDLPFKYEDLAYLRLRHEPPPRRRTGFDLEQSYKGPEMVEALLRGFAEIHPRETRLEEIGTSAAGRPIWALAVGRSLSDAQASRPAILLTGSHHGDELLATEVVLEAAGLLLEEAADNPRAQRWLDELVIWCVPIVNPDGVQAFLERTVRAGRKNGRDTDGDGTRGVQDGVDLNRNYPFRWAQDCSKQCGSANPTSRYYRGASPGSEPETRAVMQLADRERFAAAVSYHLGNIAVLAPYTIGGVRNPEPNEAWLVAEEVVAAMPPHPEGRRFVLRSKLYSVQGTDQDWLRHEHGTVALLVEGGSWPPPIDAQERRAALSSIRPSWMALANRLLDGPSLSGQVRDRRGRPLEATVEIAEVATFEGERWSTRPRDGRFDRFLPQPGIYRLRASLGRRTVERRVEVNGHVTIDLTLP